WLAAAVLWVALVVLACELLGALHAFDAAPLVALSGVAGVAVAARRRVRLGRRAEHAAHRRLDPVAVGVATVAIAIVAADWMARVQAALQNGMPNVDTLWYHMPVAAR